MGVKVVCGIYEVTMLRYQNTYREMAKGRQKQVYERDIERENMLLRSMSEGIIPPQDISLEQSYLGALMLFNDSICRDSMRRITHEDFYKEEHRAIYRAINTIVKEGRRVDILLVVVKLREHGDLEKSGGPQYIAKLTGMVASSVNADSWAKILKEKSIKRSQITTGMRLMANGYDDTVDCFKTTQEAVKELFGAEPGGDVEWIDNYTLRSEESDIVTFMDKPFVSAGNIAIIIAPPGTGKSNVCDVICVAGVRSDVDTLGFKVELYGKKILYLDTERSHNDSIRGWDRMRRRVGETHERRLMEVVRHGRMKETTIGEKVSLISSMLATGDYKLMVIDLVTDLVINDNDHEETGEVVSLLTRLSSKHDVGIIVTIHDNPTNSKEKATGVIGSRLMKKGETVAYLKREEDDKSVVVLTTDFAYGKARNSSFVGRTLHMRWDDQLMGYGTTEYTSTTPKADKEKKVTPELWRITKAIFDGTEGDMISPKQLAAMLGDVLNTTSRLANYKIRDLHKEGKIEFEGTMYKIIRDKKKTKKIADEEDEF